MKSLFTIILLSLPYTSLCFSILQPQYKYIRSKPSTNLNSHDHDTKSRKAFIKSISSLVALPLVSFLPSLSSPSNALVQGIAPPPKKGQKERKCINVEECQEMAERLAQKEADEARKESTPFLTTAKGTRYLEISDGNLNSNTVKENDSVAIKYKVLKAGKRSYDGISGEGTIVFSRGYGLEDDETSSVSSSFDFQVSSPEVINALNDGIIGMHVNGVRRISVLPQKGWRVATKACDGGPGGSGQGGDLKTDYVIVPTATMVAQESCFDMKKLPFPKS